MTTVLTKHFFKKNTVRMAEELLGAYLIRSTQTSTLIGKIVETEAYLGLKDPSCHSFKGKGASGGRAQSMYLPAGHAYVYFIYGMYYCFNVVTGNETEPEAVLIRAVEPVKGFSEMQKNRTSWKNIRQKQQKKTPLPPRLKKQLLLKELCSGPGKLCQAFNITKSLNGKNLTQKGEIYIAKGKKIRHIGISRRIGLPLYEASAYWPLRFYAKNNIFVSKPKTI